jgi:hypothetical protein
LIGDVGFVMTTVLVDDVMYSILNVVMIAGRTFVVAVLFVLSNRPMVLLMVIVMASEAVLSVVDLHVDELT